jgi:hypothetical protein
MNTIGRLGVLFSDIKVEMPPKGRRRKWLLAERTRFVLRSSSFPYVY